MKYKWRLKQIKIQTKIGPYAFAMRVEGKYFDVTKIVGDIPREISLHIYCIYILDLWKGSFC